MKNDWLYLIRNNCDESILWDEKFITHNKFTRMFAVFEIFVKFSEIHGHFNAEQRYINHGRNFINCRVSVKNLSFTYYLAIYFCRLVGVRGDCNYIHGGSWHFILQCPSWSSFAVSWKLKRLVRWHLSEIAFFVTSSP